MSLPWTTHELTQPLAGLAGSVGALWNRTSPGWVGIDFGSSSIKLAQLEKQGDAWRLKNCAVLPLSTETSEHSDLPTAALAELTRMSSLGRTFSTLQAAAVASLGLVELKAAAIRDFDAEDAGAGFDAPEPSIGQETAQWEIPAHLCSPIQGRQMLSAAMETTTVAQLAEGVAQLGLDLCTLDALPTCLARSVALVSDASPTAAVAMLDLGHGHPALTLCQEGLPVYCRRLKRCGLGELLARLATEFGLSQEECRALVGKFASCGSDARPSNSFLGAALDAYLRQLKSELIRTLEYLDSHRRDSFPEQILLCGGGATIAGIGEWLTDEVGISTRPWTLAGPARESGGDQRVHPLFAAAAALSALAWEA